MTALTIASWLILFIISAGFFYSQATKRIPSRRNVEQAPKSKFGVLKVENGNLGSRARASGVDVVFVHGLGSNPDTTWRAKNTQRETPSGSNNEYVCWVTDFLPEDIPQPTREDVRLFFYNYDSFWQRDAIQTRLSILGGEMLQKLRDIREKEEERDRGLVFIGHSYGGLVIKEALIQADANKEFYDIIQHAEGLFFLGTPHRGSNFSRWGKVMASLLQPISSNPSIVGELTYDSLFLHDLHDSFMKVATKVPHIINFFEQRKTCIFRVWWFRWEEFCVHEQSATFAGNPNQVHKRGLAADHYGLNKFGSRQGDYNIIFDELWRVIKPVISQRQRALYSVPIKLVGSFTERATLSKDIEHKLQLAYPGRARPYAAAVCGPGGTGKTQLALKYIEDHKDKFNPILWIDAESQETARSSFERCASALSIQVHCSSAHPRDSPAVQAVCRWLQHRKQSDEEWLVVFDNVDNLTWSVFDILPEGQRGNIIITSQNEQSSKLLKDCAKVSVDIMEPLEARALLFWHTDLCHESIGKHTKDVRDLCDQIAERLEYLPLAVDLARAYVAHETDPQAALEQYFSDYKKHQNRLLQNKQYTGLSGYDKTVWTVWDTTVQKIEEKFPERRSKRLLVFLAHFSSAIVQKELFRLASVGFASVQKGTFANYADFPDWLKEFLAVENGNWDDFCYRDALEPLTNYGLLKPLEGEWPGVRMHSLVRWRAMQYKDHLQDPWSTWHTGFMLAACHELLQDSGWPRFQRHIVVHIPQIPTSNQLTDENSRLQMCDIFCKTYQRSGRWIEAENLCRTALDVRKRVLGSDHPDTLTSTDYLGSLCERQGKYEESKRWHRQVLEKRAKVLGLTHLDTLTSANNLGLVLGRQECYREAEAMHRQALETREVVLGPDHPDTVWSVSNLGLALNGQGKYKEAEAMHRRALQSREKVLGLEHPDTLISLNDLGHVHNSLGKLKEAEAVHRQALEIRERILGPEHPSTLVSVNDLAWCLYRQGKLEEAEITFRRAVKLRLKVLVPGHPETAISLNMLAGVYSNQRYSNGWTSLHTAARDDLLEIVRLLDEKGGGSTLRSGVGLTLLIIASQNGLVQVVKLLLKNDANIDVQNSDGWTPVYGASIYGHLELVRLLVEKGADLNVSNNGGWTPVNFASSQGHLEVVRLLVENGADLNVSNNYGWTPVIGASINGHLKVVRLLVENGANINIIDHKNGWSAVNGASSKGHLDIVRLLVENGADVTIPNNDGWTPVFGASLNGHLEVVKLLLDNGADINITSYKGCTPVNVASMNGHLEIVRLLLERGADITIPSNDGWTPAEAASINGHHAVVQLLERDAVITEPNTEE